MWPGVNQHWKVGKDSSLFLHNGQEGEDAWGDGFSAEEEEEMLGSG